MFIINLIKTNNMKKFFLLFELIYIINNTYCSIVFNLELLPKENSKTKYELNSPKDIIAKEIISSYFTEIELGTSFQKIPLIIKPKIADFIITSIHQMSNPEKDYTSNKYVYDLSPNFLQNHNFFDENISSTYKFSRCEKRSPLDEYEKPLAELTCYSNDTIVLYTNKELTEKKILEEFYFELGRNAKDNITGTMGLNLYDMFNHVSILSLLKQKKLIDNYYWFFDFEKWDSNKGKLFLGALPHDIYGNIYSNEDLVHTAGARDENYMFYQVCFDEIYFKNSTGEKNIIGLNEKTEFNLESNVIIGTKSFNSHLNSSLQDLMEEQQCFFESFEHYYEKMDSILHYNFFYCKNTKEIKERLNKIIPDLYFYSKDLNYNLELKKEEILKENGDYIYIHIVFCHEYNSWNLGKQISLKYQCVFNPDTKQVYFYKNKKKEKKENNYLALKIIGIFVLCIIITVLGVVLGKKIYGMRKKRANELKDDDFEYFSDNNNKVALEKND